MSKFRFRCCAVEKLNFSQKSYFLENFCPKFYNGLWRHYRILISTSWFPHNRAYVTHPFYNLHVSEYLFRQSSRDFIDFYSEPISTFIKDENLLGDKFHLAFVYFHLEYNFEVEYFCHVTDRHIGHVVDHRLDMNRDHFDRMDHSVHYLNLKSKIRKKNK